MLQKVGVIGGGTMGHGIAASFALGGHDTVIFEPAEGQRVQILPAIRESIALMVEEGALHGRPRRNRHPPDRHRGQHGRRLQRPGLHR